MVRLWSAIRPPVCLVAALSISFSVSVNAAERPNIVYILADDLGYGDVQCLNRQRGKIVTEHLDTFVSQSVVFTDAHSGSSVCTPTRYGLLTGRYAWRTRLQQGVLDGSDDPPLIADGRLTVGAMLQQHGYATAAIGKWHLGFLSKRPEGAPQFGTGKRKKAGGGLPVRSTILGGPTTRGFDYFWGCSNARTMSGLIENESVIENLQPIEMLPRLRSQAIGYIQQQAPAARSGKPFFLYLPLTSPHTPIVPTAEWKGTSGMGDYADFVKQTDAVVGGVLLELDKQQLAENTLVFFSSDNGCSPAAQTENLERAGHFASGSMRGYKADIWEGGHRVPFIARWPKRVKPGSSCEATICHTDLMATCAELLGEKLQDNAAEDSVSMLPALLGSASQPRREAIVHHSIQGKFAIRQGPWKLIFCSGSGGWGEPKDPAATKQGYPKVQLYNLANDLAESNNVQSLHPNVVTQLTQLLQQYVDQGRSTPGKRQSNDVEIDIFQQSP